MGAFEFLKQPQREANLRDALDEYLRFGLEAGPFLRHLTCNHGRTAMKGDLSRNTFDRALHYSAVRLQQGRIVTDADWNEQADLTRYRAERLARDTIGACGAPMDAAGYALVAETNALAVHAVNANVAWVGGEDGALLAHLERRRRLDPGRPADHRATCAPCSRSAASAGPSATAACCARPATRALTWIAQDAGTLQHAARCRGVRCRPMRGRSATAASSSRPSTAARTGASRRPTRRACSAVHFIDAFNGLAVGQGGAIVATSDGGQTWTSVTERHRLRTCARSPCSAARWCGPQGSGGTIVRSDDFGATWLPCNTPSSATLHAIALPRC